MHDLRELKLFLASPGDVAPERQIVRNLAEEMNSQRGRREGFRIEVVGYETHTRPAYGRGGQATIDAQLGELGDYAFFVGILWNRFGTPTEGVGSGTEHEFNRAVGAYDSAGRPEIMLYFSQRPANLVAQADLLQKLEVVKFTERVTQRAYYHQYQGPDAFEKDFRHHLDMAVTDVLKAQSPASGDLPLPVATPYFAAPNTSSQPVAASAPSLEYLDDSGTFVMLGDMVFKTVGVTEQPNEVLLNVTPRNMVEDEDLRQFGGRRGSLPFAYRNQAGDTEIVQARFLSSAGTDSWLIQIRTPNLAGGMGDVNYNGYSPHELAMMRARLILLGEPLPVDPARRSLGPINAFIGVSRTTIISLTVLWDKLKGDIEAFLTAARLRLVYDLRTTHTVTRINRLRLEMMPDSKLKVDFDGARQPQAVNLAPEIIQVQGVYKLTGAS